MPMITLLTNFSNPRRLKEMLFSRRYERFNDLTKVAEHRKTIAVLNLLGIPVLMLFKANVLS